VCQCEDGYEIDKSGIGCTATCGNEVLNPKEDCDPPGANNCLKDCVCGEGYKGDPTTLGCTEIPCYWNEWGIWSECFCGVKSTRLRSRNEDASLGSKLCSQSSTSDPTACPMQEYCMKNVDSASEAVKHLLTAFTAAYFEFEIPELVGTTASAKGTTIITFHTPLQPSKRRASSADNSNCQQELDVYARKILNDSATVLSIDENSLKWTGYIGPANGSLNATCNMDMDLAGGYPFNWVPIAAAVPAGICALILFLIIGYLVFQKRRYAAALRPMRNLPPEIAKYYKDAVINHAQWEKISTTPPLYSRTLSASEVTTIRELYFDKLEGNSFDLLNVHAIYNPSLVQSFSLQKEKLQNRAESAPSLFFATKWKENAEATPQETELRTWTIDTLTRKLNLFPWNRISPIPILPVIHGTDMEVAWKICTNGFATLSSLDVGFYGSGIYFTTSTLYALQYFAGKKEPCVILSFLIPGNALPIIEHPTLHKNNFMGKVLVPGYQSHYVLTNLKGFPQTRRLVTGFYDEIVINQESQVCPAFIFQLDSTNFRKLTARMVKDAGRQEKRNEEAEEAATLLKKAKSLKNAQQTPKEADLLPKSLKKAKKSVPKEDDILERSLG